LQKLYICYTFFVSVCTLDEFTEFADFIKKII